MATLSEISIKRPVLTTVLSLLIILFGAIGYSFLGVREFPSIDPPIVTVQTNYTGANADIIGSQITEPLEESINGIAGIKSITSVSRDGRSTITVEFELSTDLEAAANDVRERVSRAIGRLPREADPPVVQKADADANPIVYVAIRSNKSSLLELSDFAERVMKERLQTIPGVSQVNIWGAKRYSMRLWMEPDKLTAHQLTPADVLRALNIENVELPSGKVEGMTTELSVRTEGRLDTEEDFNNMIIRQMGDKVIRFRDIGYAQIGAEENRAYLTDNSIPMVAVVLIPLPGANQISIADEFYKRLKVIEKELPEGYELKLGFDNTTFIRASLEEVAETIVISFLLVVVVIFLFLRDWRTTLLPVLAIPISLIGTFFVMYLLDFSINVLSLLGIVLAIGLVVDDAIVVMENIYSKIEDGFKPMQAAKEGSAEIYFAVISTTAVLAAVFMPLVFLEGFTGKLFKEFGIVVAAAVAISAFVSLTLTPMLSARLLKHREKQPFFYRITEPFFEWLSKSYAQSLDGFLRRPYLSILLMVVCFVGIGFLLNLVPKELAPEEDRNGFRIVANGPEGATFEYMFSFAEALAQMVQEEVPAEANTSIVAITSPGFGASSSVNSAFVRGMLTPSNQRNISQKELVARVQARLPEFPQAKTFVVTDPTIAGGQRGFSSLPLSIVIKAPTLEHLRQKLPEFMKAASGRSEFTFVDANLKFNKPELKVTIERDKARNAGVSVQEVAQTLQLALAEQRFGYFIREGKQYQVIGAFEREGRNAPLDLSRIYVKNEQGKMLQLENFVSLKETSIPPQVYRYDRFVSATVSAQLAPGVTLGQGIQAMEEVSAQVLDDAYSTTFTGQARDFQESSNSLYFTFFLALLLIYLVMAAQFESFGSPFVVMFTVPLALFGALASLWFYYQTVNIFSQIGMVMLIGLVTKNGILIVEFANQRLEIDKQIGKALRYAAEARFRPILMTSLCTILGILPVALALGAGSESRVSMGIAVVGGMLFSTLLSLYVVPALYLMVVKPKKATEEYSSTEGFAGNTTSPEDKKNHAAQEAALA